MQSLAPRLIEILDDMIGHEHVHQRGWTTRRIKEEAQARFHQEQGADALSQNRGTDKAWNSTIRSLQARYLIPGAVHELTQMSHQIVFEIETLQAEFIRTGFYGNNRTFPYAHYGYMMVILAQIDLVSRYWAGGDTTAAFGDQTKRMIGFMTAYLDNTKVREHAVTVQYWRHSLMHLGEPRSIYDQRDIEYTHHIRFDRDMPEDQHYTLIQSMGCEVINIDILRFGRDLQGAVLHYVADLQKDEHLQENYRKADPSIRHQRFHMS